MSEQKMREALELADAALSGANMNMDVVLKKVKEALAQQPETIPNEHPQEWKGVDGAIAFHLIERHAEGWAQTGEMMNDWLVANQQPAAHKTGIDAKTKSLLEAIVDTRNLYERTGPECRFEATPMMSCEHMSVWADAAEEILTGQPAAVVELTDDDVIRFAQTVKFKGRFVEAMREVLAFAKQGGAV